MAVALAEKWSGSEVARATLREGLGLTTPGDEVWAPLGEATKFLHPEDRVRLLVDMLPFFEGSAEEQQGLLEVKEALPQVRHPPQVGVSYIHHQ